MRALVFVLLSAVVAFGQQELSATPVQAPDNFTIPAQLSKTVDTKKCKAGDVFEMRTLEPLLISKGIVMPEDAKLHGRILGAGSRQDNKPSWVVLLVESAEWKKNKIPLHAFVTAQITVLTRVRPGSGFDASSPQEQTVRQRRRGASQSDPRNDIPIAMKRASPDVALEGKDVVQQGFHLPDDVRVIRDKKGTVFLVSHKSHLKLPSGTMLTLRQQAIPSQAPPAQSAAPSTESLQALPQKSD
jgi:hypothetical protein